MSHKQVQDRTGQQVSQGGATAWLCTHDIRNSNPLVYVLLVSAYHAIAVHMQLPGRAAPTQFCTVRARGRRAGAQAVCLAPHRQFHNRSVMRVVSVGVCARRLCACVLRLVLSANRPPGGQWAGASFCQWQKAQQGAQRSAPGWTAEMWPATQNAGLLMPPVGVWYAVCVNFLSRASSRAALQAGSAGFAC